VRTENSIRVDHVSESLFSGDDRTDLIARLIGQWLNERLGQSFIAPPENPHPAHDGGRLRGWMGKQVQNARPWPSHGHGYTQRGIPAASGGEWQAVQVIRVRNRLA
jgi:hypothetical protein